MRQENKKGFALLVLAVILAVTGALMISLMSSPPTKELQQTIQTRKKIDKIHDALIVYYKSNSSTFPCPASRALPPTDAKFGKDYYVADGLIGTACSVACTTGSALSGVTGSAGAGVMCSSATNTVKIGAVPTRTLGLPDDYSFDAWNNRLLYAVDVSNGNKITLNTTAVGGGTVPVTDLEGIAGTNNTVNAVIVSHGKNSIGSRTKSGSAFTTACTGTSATTEDENCDGDSTYIMAFKASSYDDIANYIAVPGCSVTNPCPIMFAITGYQGIRLKGYNVYKYSSVTGLPTLIRAKTSEDTSNYWYVYGGGGATIVTAGYMDDVSCVLLSNSVKSVCVVVGHLSGDTHVAYYMAEIVDPVTNTTSSPIGGTWWDAGTLTHGDSAVSCAETSSSPHKITCMAMSRTDQTTWAWTGFWLDVPGDTSLTYNHINTELGWSTGVDFRGMSCGAAGTDYLMCVLGGNNKYFSRLLTNCTGGSGTCYTAAGAAMTGVNNYMPYGIDCRTTTTNELLCSSLLAENVVGLAYVESFKLTKAGTPMSAAPTMLKLTSSVLNGSAGSVLNGTQTPDSYNVECSPTSTPDSFNCLYAIDTGKYFGNATLTTAGITPMSIMSSCAGKLELNEATERYPFTCGNSYNGKRACNFVGFDGAAYSGYYFYNMIIPDSGTGCTVSSATYNETWPSGTDQGGRNKSISR